MLMVSGVHGESGPLAVQLVAMELKKETRLVTIHHLLEEE